MHYFLCFIPVDCSIFGSRLVAESFLNFFVNIGSVLCVTSLGSRLIARIGLEANKYGMSTIQ